ncbi:FAD binding domain of DNA photolyase family protein [Leishmania donovani]|uniref:FAD binding domain of DNA photolyase family protein n=2 Tax=Leishmania donovani TaxID=5661 RepID=A0A504Y3V3_LEIDO|nr:FAD binding domain of DNA photolyase family protein [Leishmania donovani]
MDAGSVLDNLLERHRGFVAAPEHAKLAKVVRRRHGSTSSALPPSKMVEAVERGVNPLMLGVQAHKAESAAREKAKARRKGSELDASHRPSEPPARPRTASSSPRKTSNQSRNASACAVTVLQTHTQLPAVPAAREIQRAREVAVSATLTSRYQELRAKRQQEDEERKRSRSDTASVPHSAAAGADDYFHHGFSNPERFLATAVYDAKDSAARAWDLAGLSVEALLAASKPTPEPLGRSTPPLSVFALNDTTEKRCALRRLRAARRSVNDAHGSTQMSSKRGDVMADSKAAAATPETVQLPVATAQSAADRTRSSRTSRRQRKQAIRCVLSFSVASMWALAARIVAERLGTVSQLRLECMGATVPASALAARSEGAGVLPLSLARLFPLFGALVEVQELELMTAPVRLRSSRNARRARFASATGGEGARGAPELRVLQQRKGIVMEDRGDEAAPLLRVKSSPSIVRVPKHFPGASGSFVELLQRLLLRTPTTPSTSHGGREPTPIASTVTRAPATPLAGLRVLVAVFCGEVHAAAEGCNVAARHAHRGEEGPPVAAEGSRADEYPLHRLLHPSIKMKRGRSRSSSTGSAAAEKRSHTVREEVALFLFRRDLRVVDNTGLQALCDEAARRSIPVLPAFFFNPIQCDKKRNPYFGDAFFQFFCESLIDLDGAAQLNGGLVCLRGSDEDCLQRIRDSGYEVKVLGFNEDYTPFALARDRLLRAYADKQGIVCVTGPHDYSLRPLDEVVKNSEQPYSVFTPFYNKFTAEHAHRVAVPLLVNVSKVQSMLVSQPKKRMEHHLVDPALVYAHMPQVQDHGGRTEGLKRLACVERLKQYADARDDIAGDRTSHLSPHMKCGTVSTREVWHASVRALGTGHPFTRQLVWREFYAMLAFTRPRLLQGQLNSFIGQQDIVKATQPKQNAPFQPSYDNFKWSWKAEHFEAFKEGRTGVPLVDAAVRCLTATGWCHNRCRLVISNFAVKVLGIDWRECERWFATVAVDYDAANNNGGWLWSSGQGADAQPYFRTFNAFRQSERFDPDCKFIFQWVPELAKVPPSVVHHWEGYCARARGKATVTHSRKRNGQGNAEEYSTSYPAPIVDIKAATKAVVEEFKKYGKYKEN